MYACAANEAEPTAIHDVIFGAGRHRPLPARQTQACRAAEHVGLPCDQLHLPRAVYPRQRNVFGVSARGSRRHFRDDDEARRRHRCTVRGPLHQLFVSSGGEVRYRAKAERFWSTAIA
jgi:hypothetical protein